MNTDTGVIISHAKLAELPPDERRKYIEVRRDLSKKEAADMQIRLYSALWVRQREKVQVLLQDQMTPQPTNASGGMR